MKNMIAIILVFSFLLLFSSGLLNSIATETQQLGQRVVITERKRTTNNRDQSPLVYGLVGFAVGAAVVALVNNRRK